MPMQAQRRPRGLAGKLTDEIAKAIDKVSRQHKGKVTVSAVLRALEWNRYRLTEAVVAVTGQAPGAV
jgi:hypothetical protein